MPVATIQVKGFDELQKKLAALGGSQGKKIVRSALRAGAKPIQKAAKNLAPKRTGRLAKSIKVRTKKSRRRSELAVSISSSGTDNLFEGTEFYGGFIEKGWLKVPTYTINGKIRSLPRGTEPRKKIEGKHFMQQAANQAAAAAVSAFTGKVAAGIANVVKSKG